MWHNLLIIFVLIRWVITFVAIIIYWKFCLNKKVLFTNKYIYEQLPILYDQCNGFTAKQVYLIRMAYGHRNKRFFFPKAIISLRFYDCHNKNVATIHLNPTLLTENHRRYLRLSNRSSSDFFLYGKLMMILFLCCVLI